jgi:hypothetical protein
MKLSRTWIYGLLAVVVVFASAWLTRFTDEGLGTCWTHHVLRNWEQFGFARLHGSLVFNPGGFEAETSPMICTSHRAASLYPAFLCYQFLGGEAGIFVYYALLAAMVFWSVWRLLGRTEAAFWLGAVAVLAPGYVRWQTTLDPNLAAAVFGFPYCAALIALLQRPVWRWPHLLMLAALIVVFSMVNWTTAFVHGMMVAFMLVAPGISWRRLFTYVGLGMVCAGAVVAVSVSTKLDPAKGGGMTNLLAGYAWGDAGYGAGMATSTAVLRLAFTNLAGLLPVWAFLAWRSRWPGMSAGVLATFLPLLSAALSLFVLRNYAGHHPWMSCHFILLGLILSAWLLKARLPARPAFPALAGLVALVATFVFAWVMLAVGHKHDDRQLAVIHFIRDQTPRAATLVAAQDRDPELPGLLSRLEMDRHYVVVPTLSATEMAGTNQFVITTVKPSDSSRSLVHLDVRESGNSWMSRLLDMYSKLIAHRRPGDKVEVQANDFYIYRP